MMFQRKTTPLIYLGPMKTLTSYLYYALGRFQEYQPTAIKEWHYLTPLYRFGELDYLEKYGTHFGSAAYESTWKSILHSHREHLEYFESHPTGKAAFVQLQHTARLIFERNSMENYAKLFTLAPNQFLVDLDPSNHLVPRDFLLKLLPSLGQPIFLVGLRAFTPHISSLIHERFVWFGGGKSPTLAGGIDEASVGPDDFTPFHGFMSRVLDKVIGYYTHHEPREIDRLEKRYAKEALKAKPGEVIFEDRIDVAAIAIYKQTNWAYLLSKLSERSLRDRCIIYNAPRLPSNLDVLRAELAKKGLRVTLAKNHLETGMVRESRPNIMNEIFSQDMRNQVVRLQDLVQSQFSMHLDDKTLNVLFPSALDASEQDWYAACRRVDKLVEDFLVDPRLNKEAEKLVKSHWALF